MTHSSKIEVRDLHKSFGAKKVLRGVTLDVPKGSSLVVIGGSGTGKSVLLKSIIGTMRPSSGEIFIDGENVVNLSESERQARMHKFGYLFQGGALFDSMSIWENIAFGLIQGQRMDRNKARDIAYDKLAQVGMESDVGVLFPAELSGGMQKRVSLARAIATEPEILFFDEPTTGLDPIMSDVINNLIVKCVKELGATSVTITHDMASARKIADNIAMLYEGQIIWHDAIEKLDKSGNGHVEQFINGLAEGPIKIKLQDH